MSARRKSGPSGKSTPHSDRRAGIRLDVRISVEAGYELARLRRLRNATRTAIVEAAILALAERT